MWLLHRDQEAQVNPETSWGPHHALQLCSLSLWPYHQALLIFSTPRVPATIPADFFLC